MTTLVRGAGSPVTVFAHGYGATAADSRPFGSGVTGTKVFYTALAHDGIPAPEFGYRALADQLRGIADHHGAHRAFGASMGAGALCRLLSQTPTRFDKAVFFLPAVLDEPRRSTARDRLVKLGGLAAAGDVTGVAGLLLAELPADVRDTSTATAYATRHAETICLPSMRGAAEQLVTNPVIDSADALDNVTADALVVGSHGDDAHPVEIAEQLAARLPGARLHVFDDPAVMWTRRRELRELIGGFLS